MPVTYVCDSDSGFIRTRCTGNVTLPEVIEHFRDLEADPSLPARLDVLLDLTEMESLPASDQLTRVAREVSELQSKLEWGACAIVAVGDALYGMGRVLEVFAAGSFARSRVFRNLDEADRWLETARVGGSTA